MADPLICIDLTIGGGFGKEVKIPRIPYYVQLQQQLFQSVTSREEQTIASQITPHNPEDAARLAHVPVLPPLGEWAYSMNALVCQNATKRLQRVRNIRDLFEQRQAPDF